MKTPFFGSAYQARSLNLADQRCINLYPSLVETKSGKGIGAFYSTPGLDLLLTVGTGPLRGFGILNGTLYAASGNQIWSISGTYVPTLLGTMVTSRGPVSVIENGQQLVFFDGVRGYLVPGGFPLTGGTIATGGTQYQVGDTINLQANDGKQNATAQIKVTGIAGSGFPLTGGIPSNRGHGYNSGDAITLANTGGTQVTPAILTVSTTGSGYPLTGGTIAGTMGGYAPNDLVTLAAVGGTQITPAIIKVLTVSSGAISTFSVLDPGLFSVQPTSFTQAATSGTGTGMTITSPTYGSFASGVITVFTVSQAGLFSAQPTAFTQASTSGSGTAFALSNPAYGSSGSTGAVVSFSIVLTGAFNPQASGFTQASTSNAGSGFTLTAPTYGTLAGIYVLSLPFSGPVSASYQDGFGVVNSIETDTWWQSNLFDLSLWDPLNFSSADSQPDPVVAIANLHREFFLLKEDETEVWINAGLPGFAFERLPGVYIQMGCAAPFSVALAGENLIWLGRNQQGEGQVMMIVGYEPVKISTQAIDFEISQYCEISDAIAYCYQDQGALFYVITFPEAGKTWAYDVWNSRLAGIPLWHERAAFVNGQFQRHQGNCFINFNGVKIVGDYASGNVYQLDADALTDAGAPRKWLRSWRALPQPQFQPVTFSSLQIDMQTGIGVPEDTNPQCILRWSDDGGHAWSNERFQSVGKTGETARRVVFRRLGSTRYNSGLDRYFELSSSDVFPAALIGADLM